MKFTARNRRLLWVAVAVLLLYTIVGFLVLPPIVRAQLEKRLSAETGRRVTVEHVRLNPFTLAATLENFAVQEPDGTTRFLGWERLYVNFDAWASLWGEWVLGEIALERFGARVVLERDGQFNFSDVLAKLAPADAPSPAAGKPARPLRIAQLRIVDTRVDFTDRSRPQPFATTLGPLSFVLSGFRTVSESGAPYRFEAITEAGEKLSWSGTLQAQPVRSVGEFNVEGIRLPKYAPYYADAFRGTVASGTLTLRGRYEFDLTPDHRVMSLHEGALQLRDLRITEPGSQVAVLELPSLDVLGAEADALARKANVKAVAIAGGQARIRRAADGTVNLLELLPPSAEKAAQPSASAPAAPGEPVPELSLDQFTITAFHTEFSDESLPRPAQVAVQAVEVSLKEVRFPGNAAMPLHVALDWQPRGTVTVDGTISLSPLKAELRTQVTAFELLPLSPYLEQLLKVQITRGIFHTGLTVTAALPAEGAVEADVSGDVSLDQLALADTKQNEDLAGFQSLSIRGMRVSTKPETQVHIAEIALGAPYARIFVAEDRSLNLAAIGPAATAPTDAAPEEPKAEPDSDPAKPPLPKITVDKITVTDGDYRFTDRSVQPHVNMAIAQFGASVAGLSSERAEPASVDVRAVVNGAGPVAIKGQVAALVEKPSADVTVDIDNVDLLPLSPYSGKYAGFELARGSLVLDTHVQLDGDRVDSSNVVTLHHFTFGNPVQSEDATKLPVRLGVALLKDRDGKIVIDVPVQGSAADPSFQVGRVVQRVIGNLLTKAATSPFSLLGAAFGGGGEELAFQEFAPGSSELQPNERPKLETMTKALANRPALSLQLNGSYDDAADAFALRQQKLVQQVKSAAWELKRQSDPAVPPLEQFSMSPEDEAVIVRRMFDERFPPGTEFGAPLSQRPEVAAAPEPPRGWLSRAVSVLTLRGFREARAARREGERREEAQAQAAASATNELPLEQMRGRLAEAVPVTADDLRALGTARAQRVRDYFVTEGQIAAERLLVAENPNPPAPDRKGPRVFLALQ